MSINLKLQILTPERQFYDGYIVELKTENEYGHIEVLANHMPMVTLLKPSSTEFTQTDGKKLRAFTSNGVMKIRDNNVEILCNAAEWPEEIDRIRAEEAKRRAEERLSIKGDIDVKRAQNALIRALMRLRITQA